MGLRGPPPTPTAILKLRGSHRGNERKGEPHPTPGRPTRPAWLCPEARKMWKRMVNVLEDMGVLTIADGNALARYCQCWARWRECEEKIKEFGEQYPVKQWVEDGNGGKVEKVVSFRIWPFVRVGAMLAEQMSRLEHKFGLTPADRASMANGNYGARKENTDEGDATAELIKLA